MPTVTVHNRNIAKFGTHFEWQTPLKFDAVRQGPWAAENLVDEKIQTKIKGLSKNLTKGQEGKT